MRIPWYRPYLYLVPAFVMFGAFLLYPLGYSFYLGFTRYSLATSDYPQFIGLQHYISLLTKNPTFLTSLVNQLKFGVPFFLAGLFLSFLCAVFINAARRGKSFFQVVIYLPLIIPESIAAIIFLWMFDNTFGIVNYILRLVSVTPRLWFEDSVTTIYMFVPIKIWIALGFPMLIFLSGLQSIPNSLYEASTIDGSSFLQDVLFITIPLMRNYIIMVCVWLLINSLKLFELPYVLTGGGPGVSTYTMYFFSWSQAFQSFKMGSASAAAYINGLLILLLAWLINLLAGKKEVN